MLSAAFVRAGTDAMTGFATVRYDRSGSVGTLTLARPEKHNAQNPLMWRELAALGEELLADGTLRCLVVTGEGPSFSAGIDLVEGLAGPVAEQSGQAAGGVTDEGRQAAGTFRWIPRLSCPSVAAVHGHAYGAGLQLALACDFRIFARNARVGLRETRFGLMPDMGATVRLPRIIGEARARELILLGETIDSTEALRIGLANRVVDDGELRAAAAALADQLAAQPPLAIEGARRALDAAWYLDPDQAFEVALEAQFRCLASEDFRRAVAALAEGRTPEWQGC